ncbi:MAG: nuclear transport factor 2 family protein [Rhodobacteraceae bacterium]|nr:nuclear transport factor 2 family protein [Paracoccaceae bacterium]
MATLVACERRVWDALVSGDASVDAAALDARFLGVYPDGFSGKAAHVAQLADGPTVLSYKLSDTRVMHLGSEHVLLCYCASYTRVSRTEPEVMYVSSIWERHDGGWLNVFSQDTPAGEAVV